MSHRNKDPIVQTYTHRNSQAQRVPAQSMFKQWDFKEWLEGQLSIIGTARVSPSLKLMKHHLYHTSTRFSCTLYYCLRLLCRQNRNQILKMYVPENVFHYNIKSRGIFTCFMEFQLTYHLMQCALIMKIYQNDTYVLNTASKFLNVVYWFDVIFWSIMNTSVYKMHVCLFQYKSTDVQQFYYSHYNYKYSTHYTI